MKLATLKDGSRDGQLVVVSRDLTTAHYASGIASRLQQLLDDWNFLSPQLEELSTTLNHGRARHAFAFDPAMCMAPLPRAYQRVDAAAYLSHVERMQQAQGAVLSAAPHDGPLVAQVASDDLQGAREPIVCASNDLGIDFAAALAVVTGDVPMACDATAALENIRLLMLANDVRLRRLMPSEPAQGLGPLQSRPAAAFGPVAVTPDELGSAWRGGRVHLNVETVWNGKRVGLCDAGADMDFHFGQLIAQVCTARRVRAGGVVGSGPVSSRDASRGVACIAERRAIETIDHGEPKTGFMTFGDTVRIEMKGLDGSSVFGAIEQRVVAPT